MSCEMTYGVGSVDVGTRDGEFGTHRGMTVRCSQVQRCVANLQRHN